MKTPKRRSLFETALAEAVRDLAKEMGEKPGMEKTPVVVLWERVSKTPVRSMSTPASTSKENSNQ